MERAIEAEKKNEAHEVVCNESKPFLLTIVGYNWPSFRQDFMEMAHITRAQQRARVKSSRSSSDGGGGGGGDACFVHVADIQTVGYVDWLTAKEYFQGSSAFIVPNGPIHPSGVVTKVSASHQ